MNEIRYIPPESLPDIFYAIESYLQNFQDPTSNYLAEKDGVDKLASILAMVRTDYYPNFYSKAAYLFLAVNKGHFFVNGNKRLAITMLKVFYTLNGYELKKFSRPSRILNKPIALRSAFFHNDWQLVYLYELAKVLLDPEYSNLGFDKQKSLIAELLSAGLEKI